MHFNLDELQLIHFTDERMTTRPPAFDFEKDGDKAEELAAALHSKMVEWDGAGLSANQVGLPYRVFVIGTKEEKIAFFNPNVVGVSKEEVAIEEGCLSFPGFFLTLRRPKEVFIEWQDEKGEMKSGKFQGIGARVVLHEYDHMEGINFTFHASNFKLKWELDKWKKRQLKLQKRLAYGR
jgi:peptide deformylase